jgi:WD40 repeat protein
MQQASLLQLHVHLQVYDVAWCPSNSTVFAAVTADGRLEVWDFAVSTLRPVCQHAVTKNAMTALLFAKVRSLTASPPVDCSTGSMTGTSRQQ